MGEQGYSGCGQGQGGRHNFCKLLLYFSFFPLLRKRTHTACSNPPCDTKSIKKLGAGDLREGQAGDQSLGERWKDRRERINFSVENGDRAREGSDGVASERCVGFGDGLLSSRRVRPPRMLFGVRASGY